MRVEDVKTEAVSYLTPEQWAQLCDITTRTVYNRLRAGKVPGAWKDGRQWRVPSTAVYKVKKPRKRPRGTLCWDCARYCGGCSWTAVGADGAVQFVPVSGWTARTCQWRGINGIETSYEVLACPLFEEG